jgi:hypothetical protein
VLQAKEHAPTLSPSVVFNFGLAVKSIKELGGALVMMTTTSTSIGTPTMKVKRPKEGGLCVTFYIWVLFCGGSSSSFTFLSSPKKFLSPRI